MAKLLVLAFALNVLLALLDASASGLRTAVFAVSLTLLLVTLFSHRYRTSR